jgi:CDP-diacylglycerol--glycerol-3-phosphate 3-phosphatidyltransferase
MKNTINELQKQIKVLQEDFKETSVLFKNNKLKNIPNYLTITRLLLVPVIAVLFFLNVPVILFTVSFIASFTDFLDGFLARKLNAFNTFGKKLDPLADKLLAGTLLIINSLTFQVFTVSIILEVIIARINMKALSENKKTKTSQEGRIKTATLYVALLLGLFDKIVPMVKPLTMLAFAASSIMQAKTIQSYISSYDEQEEPKKIEIISGKKENTKSLKSEKELLKDLKNELTNNEIVEENKKTLI